MDLTQERLNEIMRSYTGEPYGLSKDDELTLRTLIIEVILCRDEKRSGDERIKGFTLASKVNEPMGILVLSPADIKLIETRMDSAPVVINQDFLYGTLAKILKEKEVVRDGV